MTLRDQVATMNNPMSDPLGEVITSLLIKTQRLKSAKEFLENKFNEIKPTLSTVYHAQAPWVNDPPLYADPVTKVAMAAAKQLLPGSIEQRVKEINDPQQMGVAAAFNMGALKFAPKGQIVSKLDDIMPKNPVNIKDVWGEPVVLKQGEKITPHMMSDNKVMLKDGDEFLVNKGQYETLKQQSRVSGKEFAPELKQVEETVKGQLKNKNIAEKNLATLRKQRLDLIEKSNPFTRKGIDAPQQMQDEFVSLEEKIRKLESGLAKGADTKFSQYTLPGGENYREVLIKAPVKSETGNLDLEEAAKVLAEDHGRNWRDMGAYERQSYVDEASNIDRGIFRSSHWDEPNVLSHLRMNDRITSDGKKVLFLEELQSDWARKVREQRQATNPAWQKVNGAPNHPLLKNWQEMSLKRALKEAVDGDYEYLSWVSGKQTADRYNLAKAVDSLDWIKTGENRVIRIAPKEGSLIKIEVNPAGKISVVNSTAPQEWIGKSLDEAVGKGVAEKIYGADKGLLKGEGLNIGGEWANNLYDRQVPNILKDLTGNKTEKIKLGIKQEAGIMNGIEEDFETISQQAIKITPEIKKMVLGK